MTAFDQGVVKVLGGSEEPRPLESRYDFRDLPTADDGDDVNIRRRPRHAEREDGNASDEDMIHAVRAQYVLGNPKDVVESSSSRRHGSSSLQTRQARSQCPRSPRERNGAP